MNIFSQFVKSLYSPQSIALFRFQKIGKPIFYAFLLSFLAFLPNAIHFSYGIVNGLKDLDHIIQTDLPSFTIEDGILSSDNKKTIERKSGDYIVIFDNEGMFTKEEIEIRENAIGFLKHELVLVSDGTAQSFDYGLLESPMTKTDLVDIVEQVKELLPIILSVLLFLLYFGASFAKFFEITILALIAIIFKNKLNKKLNFKQLWILSAYAITLSTTFFIIMDALQTTVPFKIYINWFIHLMILFLTLKEIPSPKQNSN
ncbi:DUF1189 domain-containing protein [Bacillus sp. FJAT-47783]|uniref:DUF1189 domain-containing protein n=1 Tax=Bacillus sp. FJAT-47783 TaxID=2922712 RepID=UPI001FADFC1D|nr:DUF1189 domain-containing protein [Bacillus sp. FJAT-47783]